MKRITAAQLLAAPCHSLFTMAERGEQTDLMDGDLYAKRGAAPYPDDKDKILVMLLRGSHTQKWWYMEPRDYSHSFWIWDSRDVEMLLYSVAYAAGSACEVERFLAELRKSADTSSQQDPATKPPY